MIETIKVGPLATNCYIVYDDKSKEAIVIDPGYEDDDIVEFIEKNELKLKYIYLTHCHFDHIEGANWLKNKFDAKVLTYFAEEENMKDSNVNLSKMMMGDPLLVKPDKLMFENDEIEVGSITFRVMHTPGHTSGSSALYDGENLFSGDTVFKDTFGRTDFPTGNMHEMIKTVDRLLTLPSTTKVFPGHNEATMIGEIRPLE